MTINEIIALAKAGYKKKDIDAYLAAEDKPEPDTSDPDTSDLEPVIENGQKDGAEDNPDPQPDNADDEIKTELEKTRAELEDLKKKLAAAQKENIKKNNDSHTDTAAEREKRIQDYARRMM